MTASPIAQQFRDGLAKGELLIQQCEACGKPNMYPRFACPHCQSEELGWARASGEGRLMSVTVLRAGAPVGFEDELPYALGVVRLAEDVQLLARLVPDADGDWSSYTCDMAVAHVAATDKPYAVFGHAGDGGP